LNLVRKFADRVAVMEDGYLVEHGPVAQVFAHPRHAYTRKLIDSRPVRNVTERPAPPEPPVMQASGMQVSYPVPIPGFRGWFRKGRFIAVREAGFSIAPGRTLGVVGESGSGKSTLALAALGLMPHKGELEVVGRRWGPDAAGNKAIRRMVQVVFQDPYSSLSPRMTVEEIVGEGLLVHAPDLALSGRRERVIQALREVGLSEDQFPGLLQRLQREKRLSYMLITHDVDVIRAMAHDVVVMKDGDIVEAGSVAQVLDAPQQDYTRTLVAAAS